MRTKPKKVSVHYSDLLVLSTTPCQRDPEHIAALSTKERGEKECECSGCFTSRLAERYVQKNKVSRKRRAGMRTKRGSWIRKAQDIVNWQDDEVDEEREMILEVEIEPGDPGSLGEYPPGHASAMIVGGKFDDGEEIPQEVLEKIELDPSFQEMALEKYGPLSQEEIAEIKGDIAYHALADEGRA